MVKIRLRRTGAKKKPSYRVVAADARSPRDGRFIEILGYYDPRANPVTFHIHEDRVLYWLSVGAQPTDTVRKLLANAGTLDRFARLKAGADLEELLAEARAAKAARVESQDEPAELVEAVSVEEVEAEAAETEEVAEEQTGSAAEEAES